MIKLKSYIFQTYRKLKYSSYYDIYIIFKDYTMTPINRFVRNLTLVNHFRNVEGCVIECGTWRGGMIGGIAKTLGDKRQYFLFDSYEGLPVPTSADGGKAFRWQNDKESPGYYDNCSAEMSFAENAMKLSGVSDYKIIKGWFSETLPLFGKDIPIAVLRLDGDWYESTMQCLENLYDLVVPGGLIIIDDYYAWDGCASAVHDFLSRNNLPDRISQWENDICYMVKSKKEAAH